MYLYMIICIISLICIFYTLAGGMKAVIWADTINGVALIATIITIAVRMLYEIPLGQVMETCSKTKCQSFTSSWLTAREHFDITYRNPPLYYAVRMFVDCIITLPLQQAMVQRFNMCETMNKGRQSMAYGAVLIVTTIGTSVFIGMATLTHYHGNDPLCLQEISRPDEIVPKLVLDLFSGIPGFTGVFIVAVYSATLSSFSAFLSSSALVFLPVVENVFELSPNLQIRTSRLIIGVVGTLTVILSISMSQMQDTLLGILFMTTTNLGAPFFGTVLCGMFLPFVNKTGILSAMFAPLVPISMWIAQRIVKPVGSVASQMITNRISNCSAEYELSVQNVTFGCQVSNKRHCIHPNTVLVLGGCSRRDGEMDSTAVKPITLRFWNGWIVYIFYYSNSSKPFNTWD